MKLFEVIPERLFQVFSGSNRQIYAEALLLLYEQYQINRFGIHYDIMRDLMQELLETQEESGWIFEESELFSGEEGVTKTQELKLNEEKQPQPFLDNAGEDPFRTKSNALLRRLNRLQWIQIEDQENFQQYIVLPHYSSRLLALFKELCENRTVEYQRFAFALGRGNDGK